MRNVEQQKCPNCTGALRFDPLTGKMVCDFCDSEFEVEQETEKNEAEKDENEKEPKKDGNRKNQIEGFDFRSLMTQAETPDCQALPIYNCESCGAEIIAADAEFSLTCPFCQNNVILTEKATGNLRPDGIIPFKITPDKLSEAVRKYYRKEKFIPKKFFTDNKMGKVTGIYVPFWVFDGDVEGTMYYTGEKYHSRVRVGDYMVTSYGVYELTREVSLSFKDIPVDASEKMDDAMMDSIEPFDMSELKPFDLRYLAGFAADRFDVAARYIAGRAKRRMTTTLSGMAERKATSGYTSTRSRGNELKANINAKYILMPVYQFELEYAEKKYCFAVNGQTGKVTGELPYDEAMAGRYRMLRFLLTAGGIIGFAVLRYLIGR